MTAFCVGANATFANQLGTWLGEGDLALTRVYSANGPPIGGWGAFHTPQRGGGHSRWRRRLFAIPERIASLATR